LKPSKILKIICNLDDEMIQIFNKFYLIQVKQGSKQHRLWDLLLTHRNQITATKKDDWFKEVTKKELGLSQSALNNLLSSLLKQFNKFLANRHLMADKNLIALFSYKEAVNLGLHDYLGYKTKKVQSHFDKRKFSSSNDFFTIPQFI